MGEEEEEEEEDGNWGVAACNSLGATCVRHHSAASKVSADWLLLDDERRDDPSGQILSHTPSAQNVNKAASMSTSCEPVCGHRRRRRCLLRVCRVEEVNLSHGCDDQLVWK